LRDQYANLYDQYAVLTEDTVSALDDLDTPGEVEDEHDRLVDTLSELPAVTYNYANGIRDAESQAEFDAAFADTAEGEAIAARVAEACAALQAIADEHQIATEVRCQ
jgi:hypothetical protein